MTVALALTFAGTACTRNADLEPASESATRPAQTCQVEVSHSTHEKGVYVRADAGHCPLSDVMAQLESKVPSLQKAYSIVVVRSNSEEINQELRGIWEAACLRRGGRGRDVSRHDFLLAYRESPLARALTQLMAKQGAQFVPATVDNYYVLAKQSPQPGTCDSDLLAPLVFFKDARKR